MNDTKNRKVGLALGGGVVLGAAHVGVIRAVEEAGIKVSFLGGTSAGALVAALYAFGMPWKEMRELLCGLNWLDISKVSLSRFGVLSMSRLEELLEEHLGEAQFQEADIPLAIIATDISSGEKVVLKQGPVAKAVMASSCVPGVFTPVELDGRLLVDGGMLENVPVSALREMGAEFIIGVDLNARQNFSRPDNIIELLINAVNLTLQNATGLQTGQADLLIEPDLSRFSVTDTSQINELVEEGYQSAREQLQNALDDG